MSESVAIRWIHGVLAAKFLIVLILCQVYIIDFGLAKMYRDLKTHQHIPYKACMTDTTFSISL